MPKLKLTLIALSISFLSSCETAPKRFVRTERCVPVIEQIPDSIDRYTGYCRCHDYQFGENTGRISDSRDKPLTYCSKAVSFPQYVRDIYPFILEWEVFLKQQESK